MNLETRKKAFLTLADRLQNLPENILDEVFNDASMRNPWFTWENLYLAIKGLIAMLDQVEFLNWVSRYNIADVHPRRVGIVMAGNIPLVGIHDLISVLVCGHKAVIKLSSQDEVMVKYILSLLVDIEPAFASNFELAERLSNFDAVIATGSDNTSRYFHYYFDKYPHIIRKNRTSVAVLDGLEKQEELADLGRDVFSYFGLGCRNVSKLFIPRSITPAQISKHWGGYIKLADHHKYHNNYHYQRSILLMNQDYFHDTGYALLVESDSLVSPISMVYFQYYDDVESIVQHLITIRDKIQCIVSSAAWLSDKVNFGMAQMPGIADYADGTDTMKFLTTLP